MIRYTIAIILISACQSANPKETCIKAGKYKEYRGTESATVNGVKCQAWDSQSPHEHTRTAENYPDSGLEANFCRDPDDEPGVWCYTTDSEVRWDYCHIPTCFTTDPSQICSQGKQKDYRGVISTSISGVRCQAWESQYPHSHTRVPANYPESDLEANYCRNPGFYLILS